MRSVVLLCVVAACAGEGPEAPPLEPGLFDDAAIALCERDAACDTRGDRFFDMADCLAETRARLAIELEPLFELAIDDGTILFHDASTPACLDGMRSAGCDLDVHDLPAACDDVFRGDVPDGSGCRLTAECEPGASCAQVGVERCDRACARLGDAGATCELDAECARGLVCVDASCTALGREGDACAAVAASCAPGLHCAGEDEELGISGTCRAIARFGIEGMACDPEGLELCGPELACAIEPGCTEACAYRCVARPASGAACTLGFFPIDPCPSGESCAVAETALETDRGVCTPYPSIGEPCSDRCASGRCFFDPGVEGVAEGTCIEPLAIGSACADDAECASDLCDGVCVAAACAWEEP